MSTTENQRSCMAIKPKIHVSPIPSPKIIKEKIHNINRLFKRYINFSSVQQDYVTKALYQKNEEKKTL